MRFIPFGFNKGELITVSAILLFVIVAIVLNLQVSLRKGRDIQRKNDIRAINDAVSAFQNDFGALPLSDSQGRILACISDTNNPQVDQYGNVLYEPCEWGVDALADVFDPSYPPYLKSLPDDPLHDSGRTYYYESNGSRFQIYGALEGTSEPEYDESILPRALKCGTVTCNFGRSNLDTPLDKSVEEYENELRERYKLEQQNGSRN